MVEVAIVEVVDMNHDHWDARLAVEFAIRDDIVDRHPDVASALGDLGLLSLSKDIVQTLLAPQHKWAMKQVFELAGVS